MATKKERSGHIAVIRYVNDIAFSGLAAYAMVLSVAAYVTGFLLRAMFS